MALFVQHQIRNSSVLYSRPLLSFPNNSGGGTMLAVGVHFFRTIKVESVAIGCQRRPRNLAVHQTAKDGFQSCLYHRWLISRTHFLFHFSGAVTASHHCSLLRTGLRFMSSGCVVVVGKFAGSVFV